MFSYVHKTRKIKRITEDNLMDFQRRMWKN